VNSRESGSPAPKDLFLFCLPRRDEEEVEEAGGGSEVVDGGDRSAQV